GMMKMEPMRRLEVPGGGKVELMPGGTHIMLFGVKTALKDGAKAVLTLHFEKAGDLQVEAVVRAPEGKKDAH
ncbi:MAG TPA: copper chaperone PCu(A)C, partial [Acidobacteriota bacterium]|nr:copper chaperone PCu(A)C [Acidobacteriota bacterium]